MKEFSFIQIEVWTESD